VVAVPALFAAGACGCGGSSNGAAGEETKTFKGEGYSFSYPGSWHELESRAVGPSQIDPDVVVGPGAGLNGVTVTVGPAAVPITQADLPEVKNEVAQFARQAAVGLGGEVTQEPTTTTVAGLPAVEVEVAGATEGTQFHLRMTYAWDGRTQYQLNCQYTSVQMKEITKGCDQMLSSLSVGA